MEAGFELSLDLLSNGVKRGFILMKQDKERHLISLAANVSHPAKQGLVQSFSVYIDTISLFRYWFYVVNNRKI
jgi:AGCS family alanine or glycine:cation symporter